MSIVQFNRETNITFKFECFAVQVIFKTMSFVQYVYFCILIRERPMSIIIRRKILTAIISSLIVAIIFMVPGGFNLNGFANLYYLNLMIVISYGVITSILSDWMSKKMFTSTYSREISSFLFHCFSV